VRTKVATIRAHLRMPRGEVIMVPVTFSLEFLGREDVQYTAPKLVLLCTS
jgi:hypothetical protein